jgi:tetratricopeptide (TPR) repeat protein
MSAPAAKLQHEVWRLIRANDWAGAERVCRGLNAHYPRYAAGWHAASHVAIGCGSASDALSCIDRALGIEPQNARFLLQRARCLLALERPLDAAEAARAAQRLASADAALLDSIGTVLSQANDQPGALAAYDRASALAPDEARIRFNRATVRRYLGALADAEADYDRVIALQPDDYEAYKNRAELRTQSAEKNHVAQLETLLARGVPHWQGEVQLRYALAKEYEDLGRYEASFEQLALGAALRRQHLRYDVRVDVATADWIIEAYPGRPPAGDREQSPEAPIFIVGLPRSGSTLVERILSSHSALESAGELKSFALAIVHAVAKQSGRASLPRRELVARSAELDFAALGREYLERARTAGAPAGRFTDKMPLNYLYCGLISRALPGAKIVHVSRHPMAACYAIHKSLFKDAYPFAYDLSELGQYYVAYRRLMLHWQRTLPGQIHELRYEKLVADQPGETRRLLEFCGLEWQDACVQFHLNPAASTTASAAQVRRPIYDSSVAQWRHYERQLAPLGRQLSAAGIGLDE